MVSEREVSSVPYDGTMMSRNLRSQSQVSVLDYIGVIVSMLVGI